MVVKDDDIVVDALGDDEDEFEDTEVEGGGDESEGEEIVVESEESGKRSSVDDAYEEIRQLLSGLKESSGYLPREAASAIRSEMQQQVGQVVDDVDVRKYLDEDVLEELDAATVKALNKVMREAVNKAVERALAMVPVAVGNIVDQRARQQIYVYRFYKRNPQLVGREAEVQRVASVLWERQPELQGNLDKFFSVLEKHMRRVYPPEEQTSAKSKAPKSPTVGVGVGKEKKVKSPVEAFLSGEI